MQSTPDSSRRIIQGIPLVNDSPARCVTPCRQRFWRCTLIGPIKARSEVNHMNKRFCTFLSFILLWGGVISAPVDAQATGSSLTRHRYTARRLSPKRYSGTGYSPVKFTPRRYTWQRNLGKQHAYRSTLKPARRTRSRLRVPARGPNTRRRAAMRRRQVRRRQSRAARVRTVRGGFRTGHRSAPLAAPTVGQSAKSPISPPSRLSTGHVERPKPAPKMSDSSQPGYRP